MARKLKVYRTPIGFHDAYVAAPSQKAALEAWGTDSNLFARGSADLVDDDELTQEPLANPGKVIKRLRGSEAEQLAALPPDKPKKAKTEQDVGRPGKAAAGETASRTTAKPKRKPRPSRASLDAAEADLRTLLERQGAVERDLREREREIARERRELAKAQDRERDTAERAVDEEREAHSKALAKWIEEQG